MERPQWSFDGEGEEEAEEQHLLGVRVDIHSDQGQEGEGAGDELPDGNDVQANERGEHEQATEQAVQQELDRSVGALRAAIAADHEVDRYEHDLEEDVEQENIG